MRHRFFLEDDLIKIGWGRDSTLDEWDTIMRWVLRTLDQSGIRLHILMDFSDIYVITEEVFHPEIAARLASNPQAGWILLVSQNPVFVHFVNTHWITQSSEPVGLRAFLDTTDALSWLRNRPL
jgi:hypothetical protein